MTHRSRLLLLLAVLVAVIALPLLMAPLFAQPVVDTTKTPILPAVPPGFDWWYIPIFALGMIAHFAVAMKNAAGGWMKIPFNNIVALLTKWFFTEKRYTLIAGSVTAIFAFVSGYGLNIGFSTLNPLAVAASLAAGYIGDSMFNQATAAKALAGPRTS